MTGSTVDTRVNQVYFAWRQDGGLRLVLSSHLDPAQDDKWSYRLQNRVRIYPVHGAPLPSAGFSYLVFADGTAAWVRRSSTGVTEGRNNSRALIGRSDVLDFYAAVGLSLTTGWSDEPPASGHIGAVTATKIQDAAARAQELAPHVGEYEEDLAIVLAAMLPNPAAAVSILGSVDPERLVIVWALHQIARHYLPQRFATRPNWSYSTYEDQHDTGAGDLPGIVFLPAAQTGAGAVNRVIVDLARPVVDPADLATARQIVRYLIQNKRPDESIPDSPPVVRQQPSPNGGPTLPWEPESPMAAPAPEPVPAAAPERAPVVASLFDVRNVSEFLRELRRAEDAAVHRRTVLYPHLDVADLDELARFVEVTARNELLDRVLRLTYGPRLEGSREAKGEKHALRLIRRGQSDQLARMLGAAAPPGEPVRDAAFGRWTEGAGKAPAAANGNLARQWRGARRSRYFPWVAGVAAAVLITLIFMLGYLTGRPVEAATRAPAVLPTTAAPATTRPPTEAARTTPPQQTTQQPADQNQNQNPNQNPNPGGGNPQDGTQPSVSVRADQGGTAWVFQRVDNSQFIPLVQCQPLAGSDWLCTRQPSVNGDQVAMAVAPGTDLSNRVGQTIARRDGWGQPKRIG